MKIIFFVFFCFATNVGFSQILKDSLIEILHTNVYFESNNFAIDSFNTKIIKSLIDSFPLMGGKQYKIEGHTDDIGSNENNLKLSEKRSEAVKSVLIDYGIDKQNIQTSHHGQTKPEQSNNTLDGKKFNRRTKLIIQKKFKFGLLKGLLAIDTFLQNSKAEITISNKFMKYTTSADKEGKFEVYVPYNQKISINVSMPGYFTESKTIMINETTIVKPLKIELQPIKINTSYNINDINFEGDKSVILVESGQSLVNLVNTMLLNKDLCIEIAGHINHPGKPQYAGRYFDLAENRAIAIYNHLLQKMVSKSRMSYKSYSNFKMIYPNPKSAQEMVKNRRVEIIVKDCGDL